MARLVVAGTDPEARRLAVAVRSSAGATLAGCAAATIGDAEELAAEWAVTPASPTRLPRRTQGVIISSEVDDRLAWACRCVEQGVSVLIGSPVGGDLDAIDDLIELATERGVIAGVAEPTMFAPPLVEALRRLHELGPPTHLEVRASVPITEPLDPRSGREFARAGAAALAVALALGTAERVRTGDPVDGVQNWSCSILRDGSPVGDLVVEQAGVGPASLSAQLASDRHAMRVELWPDSELDIDGVPALAHHGLDPRDPMAQLRLLGYRGMVDGFAGVLDRRGGGVCPLGFGRLVVEAAGG